MSAHETIPHGGWPNCVRLTDGDLELVATTDVGPRIIRFGFRGGQNIMKEFADMMGKTGGDAWRIYGGHRLWHAPEDPVRTYEPDNAPVEFDCDGARLTLVQATEPNARMAKRIVVEMLGGNRVRLTHTLRNDGLWPVRLAPWCLTVMAPGGEALLPQEPYGPHPDELLPARPLVLWPYTKMADPRWTWGDRLVRLRQQENGAPQKIGLLNKRGWAAYQLGPDVFLKTFPHVDGAPYPDFGCNCEAFTNGEMLEVESVGPLVDLAPGGETTQVEHWILKRVALPGGEESLEAALESLAAEARGA